METSEDVVGDAIVVSELVGGSELLSVDSLVVSKDEEVPEQVKIEHLVLV